MNNNKLWLRRPIPFLQKAVYLVALSLTIFSSPITYAGKKFSREKKSVSVSVPLSIEEFAHFKYICTSSFLSNRREISSEVGVV